MTEVVHHPAVRSKPSTTRQGLVRLAIVYAFFALWFAYTAHNMYSALAETGPGHAPGINVPLSLALAEDWTFYPDNHLELCKVYGMNPDQMWAYIKAGIEDVSDEDRPTMDAFYVEKCDGSN